MIYGFAGMTHLGLVFAATLAKAGYETRCYDEHGIYNLVKIAPGEPGLVDVWNDGVNKNRIKLTTDKEDLRGCDCIYVTLDVMDHELDKQDVRDLVDLVSTVRGPDTVVVILSQVPPGFTQSITSIPHTHLFNMLDPLIFGQSLKRAKDPDFVAIGMDYSIYKDDLPPTEMIRDVLLPWEFSSSNFASYEQVELAKIAINCYLAAQITMTNVLAEVGVSLGIHWEGVKELVRRDERIGPYLTPGLGIGGGHLLRDVATIRTLQRRPRFEVSFLEGLFTTDGYFKHCYLDAVLLANGVDKEHTIALLGLTYKFGTTSAEAAPAQCFITATAVAEKIRVHDPLIKAVSTDQYKGLSLQQFETEGETLLGAKVVIVTTPYPQYSDLSLSSMVEVMADDPILIDPFGSFLRVAAEVAGFKYITLGE